ncbi:MAG: IS4 family transposase, partial [Tepidisphaeraceae bacterium]
MTRPTSVLINPKIRGKTRLALIEAARAGQQVNPRQARLVRVVEYTVPDREGDGNDELVCV